MSCEAGCWCACAGVGVGMLTTSCGVIAVVMVVVAVVLVKAAGCTGMSISAGIAIETVDDGKVVVCVIANVLLGVAVVVVAVFVIESLEPYIFFLFRPLEVLTAAVSVASPSAEKLPPGNCADITSFLENL